MFKAMGWDVGGANIKACLLEIDEDKIGKVKVVVRYFPIWKRGKENLCRVIKDIYTGLAGEEGADAVALTITAELSDAFYTKREGVTFVLGCFKNVFGNQKTWVLDVNGNLKSMEEIEGNPLSAAAANWQSTGWMVSNFFGEAIVIDVGSTTTSIIPIKNGRVSAKGKTDLEKLVLGELVYTGALRTNVAAIVSEVPLGKVMVPVSSEFFAQSADVHLVLGNIKEDEYTVETPDGRGKSREECLARVSRVVCGDIEMLGEEEIKGICSYVYKKQIEKIEMGLRKVLTVFKENRVVAVTAGVGKVFLACQAALKAGISKIVDLGKVIGEKPASAAPSAGLAWMVACKEKRKRIKWEAMAH